MAIAVDIDQSYIRVQGVVGRQVGDEFILMPPVSHSGVVPDELITCNDCGKVIWDRLDGTKTLRQIAQEICIDYDLKLDEARESVMLFMRELLDIGLVRVQ